MFDSTSSSGLNAGTSEYSEVLVARQEQARRLLSATGWGFFAVSALLLILMIWLLTQPGVFVWRVICGFLLLSGVPLLGGIRLSRAAVSPGSPEQKWCVGGKYVSGLYLLAFAIAGLAICTAESGEDRLVALALFVPLTLLYASSVLCFVAKKYRPGAIVLIVAGVVTLPVGIFAILAGWRIHALSRQWS